MLHSTTQYTNVCSNSYTSSVMLVIRCIYRYLATYCDRLINIIQNFSWWISVMMMYCNLTPMVTFTHLSQQILSVEISLHLTFLLQPYNICCPDDCREVKILCDITNVTIKPRRMWSFGSWRSTR